METVKIGTVESVGTSTAKVRFQREKTSSAELTVLKRTREERWMPEVGEKVVCLIQDSGHGFVVGAI